MTVNAAAVRVENCVQFGGPWLALELIKKIGLDDFLQQHLPRGRADLSWSRIALVLIICRLCKPSSELHIAEHFYRETALERLLGVPAAKVNEVRLYRALDRILPHKEKLEGFLKNRLGELFSLEYDLLLYDVTSTYFEGQAKANPKAKFGYSRDKRSDCKQVCIARSRFAVRDAYRIRSIRRQPTRQYDREGNRRNHGIPLREVESRMGDGPWDAIRSQYSIP